MRSDNIIPTARVIRRIQQVAGFPHAPGTDEQVVSGQTLILRRSENHRRSRISA